MHESHLQWINDRESAAKAETYRHHKQSAQCRLRAMKEQWWSDRATELQETSDTKNAKLFYDGLKAIYGPQANGSPSILSAGAETRLTEPSRILERWAEHFSDVLNRSSTISQAAIDNIAQRPLMDELAQRPTLDETTAAIKRLSSGKAAGPDAIAAEVYKYGGINLTKSLVKLFNNIWDSRAVPQEFKDATIVHIYKRKGDKSIWDNHRGISLLCIAGKILTRILLNRLSLHLADNVLPESQCGFRAQRSTIDMIFAARQVQEKCREQNLDLYMVFVDLTKAFDTISRYGLWQILRKIGCPDLFFDIIRSFHEGMVARVQDQGQTSEPFSVTNGTKQGCVMTPLLFTLVFSAMLNGAFHDNDLGALIWFRTDGNVFNLRRLNSKTRTSKVLIRDLLFADDCALLAHTLDDIQAITNAFARSARRFGLTISLKKTEVIYQPKPGADYTAPTITIDNNPLKVTDKLTYLGSTISQNALIDDEISARIGKASGSFGKLTKRLWSERGVRLVTKINVYCTVVLPTLLYGCEAWTPYRRHIRRLNQFHMRCLRRIDNIKGKTWYQTLKFYSAAHKLVSNNTSSVRNFVGPDTLWGWPMTASPRTCSTENWTPVIEHGEDNESGIRTCLRKRWSHAAFPTTPGKPLRQTVPSGVVPATPVYETTKRRGATPWGIREWDGRLSSLHQTLTHFYVMSAADSAHHWSACIATTEHMPTQTLTEVEIRLTDGSLHTYTSKGTTIQHASWINTSP